MSTQDDTAELPEYLLAHMDKLRRAVDLIDELTGLVLDEEFPDLLGYIEDTDPEIVSYALTGAAARLAGWHEQHPEAWTPSVPDSPSTALQDGDWSAS